MTVQLFKTILARFAGIRVATEESAALHGEISNLK